MTSPPVRHVLFDADGVMQDIPGGWYAAMEPYVGHRAREFLHATWKDERPTLSGVGDYRPLLAERLIDYGVETGVDEVLADVWCRIAVDDASLALVRSLKESGFGVHLGTNQGPYRARYMTEVLDYRTHFDTCFYSCDLGVAKPDVRFFTEVAHRLGVEPSAVLFIDDSERNVHGARAAGMPACTGVSRRITRR